ncbi:serine--tRNA synthetase-like protein Slimp [Anopheles cruzii]|uniref:serine--tRNA synthetase-like protein Slimp n=1 Tax=Anopheles cruzii TaxID=68878 RepID=UPI0022EC4020|nr:serine--tRNA synthetase-like protein Slimp [Anopheles cruzii]
MLKLCSFWRTVPTRLLSSALYLTGDKAREQYAVLVPYLDFRHKLGDWNRLRRNIRLRKHPLDCENLKRQWELYLDIEKRKRQIEQCRVELQQQIQKATDEAEQKQLKARAILARDDLKLIKEQSYAIEDAFIANNFLTIPNDLHDRTPEEKRTIVHERTTPDQNRGSAEALQKGANALEEQLEMDDAICFYMTGDAALIDLLLPMRCCETFQKDEFIFFSNPDFVRSFLVEAAMVDKDCLYQIREDEEPTDKVNQLHLCGGGTLLSFLGYFTKLSVFPTALPLRLVARGKRYLQNRVQANTVHVFGASRTYDEAEAMFDEMLLTYQRFYDQLPVNYRIIQVPAPELGPAESMRVDVELFDMQTQRYVTVANLSFYSDFLSKRIAFIYQDGKVQRFPHIVAGEAMCSVELIKVLLGNGILVSDLPFLGFDDD